jgi:hypothetical protein
MIDGGIGARQITMALDLIFLQLRSALPSAALVLQPANALIGRPVAPPSTKRIRIEVQLVTTPSYQSRRR